MSLKNTLKLPAAPKEKVRNITKLPVLVEGEVVTNYTQKDTRPFFQKLSYPVFLDLSEGIYLLENDDFLKSCTNILKELNLSSNSFIEISSLGHLTKLKRLVLNRNNLIEFSIQGLSSLVYLGLCNNRLDRISDMSECKKLTNIDLSGNRMSGEGFDHLAKLKSLKVLDVSSNSINLAFPEFQKKFLEPLKKSKSLEYLSFENNPIEKRIEEFRLFIINEFPKLKYLNWVAISKDERNKASKLESEGFFAKQIQQAASAPLPTSNPTTPISTPANKSLQASPLISPNRSTSFVQRKPSVGANMVPKLSTLSRSTDLLSRSLVDSQQQASVPSTPQHQSMNNISTSTTTIVASSHDSSSSSPMPTMTPFDLQQAKILSSSQDLSSPSTPTATASQILSETRPLTELSKEESDNYLDILLNELQPNNSDFPTFASVIDQKVYLDLLYRAIIEDGIPEELLEECNKDSLASSTTTVTSVQDSFSMVIDSNIVVSPSLINMPDDDEVLVEQEPLPEIISSIPQMVKERSRESLIVTIESSPEHPSQTDNESSAPKLPTLEEAVEPIFTTKHPESPVISSTGAKDIWKKIDQTNITTASPPPSKPLPKRLPSQSSFNNVTNTHPPTQSILKPTGKPLAKPPTGSPSGSPQMKPLAKNPASIPPNSISKPLAKPPTGSPSGSPQMKPLAKNPASIPPNSISKPIIKPMIKKAPAKPLEPLVQPPTQEQIPNQEPLVQQPPAQEQTKFVKQVNVDDFSSEIEKALADIENTWMNTNKQNEPNKPVIPQELLSTISSISKEEKEESPIKKVENATSKLDEMIQEYHNPSSAPASPTNTRKSVNQTKQSSPGSTPPPTRSNPPTVATQQPTPPQTSFDPLQRMINNEVSRVNSIAATVQPLPNWIVPDENIQMGSKLGLGSFGDCFTGSAFGIPTILKKLRTQRFTDQFLGQFKLEVSQLKDLQHENLVPVSGCCMDNNILVVHPMYDATNLQTLLNDSSYQISNEFIHRVSLGVAKALTYLHSLDIVHRALKPNNILIENRTGNVLIRDYAFAFVKDGVFRTGQQSSPYLAPEIITSQCNSYDTLSDQFSFSMILLQLFTRSPIFPDIHISRISDTILSGVRPEIPENIPTVFNRLIRACWNPDASSRPTFLTISKILSQPFQRIFALSPSASIAKPTISTGTTQVQAGANSPSSNIAAKHQFSETGELNRKMLLVLERILTMLNEPNQDSLKRALKALESLSSPENHSQMVGIGLMKSLCSITNHPGIEEQLLRVIYSLSTNEQLSNEFIEAGGFAPLSRFIASDNPNIVLNTIKLVSVLADEQHLLQLKYSGILNTLTALLYSDDETILIQSVGAMSRVLLNEENQNHFIQLNGLTVLLELLNSNNTSLSMRALLALCCLISNENCKSQLHNAGIIPKLMELLSSPQKLLRLHSLKIIETMAKDNEFRKLLIEERCIQLLVHLLASSNQDDTCPPILLCLASLLRYHGIAYEDFHQAQGINHIVKLINYNQQPEILEGIFEVVYSLINHEPSRNQLKSIIPQMVEILSNSSCKPSLIVLILRCLTLFSSQSSCIETIEQTMAVSIVSTLLLRFEKNYEVKITSLKFISSLAKMNSKLSMNIHIMGILQILVNNLEDKASSIKDEAISTISWLTSSAECRSVLLQKNTLKFLIDFIGTTRNVDILERLIWAISFFALDEQGQAIIRESNKCLEFIISCLDRNEEVFKTLAIKTILILVQKPINHNALKKVGVDFQLQVLQSSSNKSIQLASRKILSLLNQ
ncbi:hypothetical protein DICPUDRAFT_147302 [Dictyostelium purpureum]|uniref:non-specific serine/threonine protein kinase n=1 Tax=Dictyostelium purpureum TaxID=5786 RepID=F0Z856_DICPU|nr:uncharacterized protein DICPUDRAFT_147302 [Dictyostelium purpureum]EGC39871.1 hypothetical protein DICPUDRAFT_147302 [Dictyostelium purpureum]|eukprot:XP_003283622.1 hypothetical protein DICPUDRAFT_147302 [Dictyostelium purpureum]